MGNYIDIYRKLWNSSFLKDSFWAVSGNGIGNFLMLLSGVLIARFLGKDLYGEYGIVKSTMYLIALLATFGIGDTSTKFIAEYLQKQPQSVKSIIYSSFRIVLSFSVTMCLLLFIFAEQIAIFVNEPRLKVPFQFLGVIIILRAIGTWGAGVLGGFKDYKHLGVNNIICGIAMFGICIPLSLLYGLKGALLALLLSQLLFALLNSGTVYYRIIKLPIDKVVYYEKTLISFSFPFALNEFVYTLSSWGSTLLLTKYSSLGELGMYTACIQWNAIILFMPSLLGNVILSYLSTTAASDIGRHETLIKRMLLVNLVCTMIPLGVVLIFTPLIVSYYGPTFTGMESILSIIVFGTVFTCLTRVFQSNLMSEGKKWKAFYIRSSYNSISLLLTYIVLRITSGVNAAMNIAILSLIINALSLAMYYVVYKRDRKQLTIYSNK